MTKRKKAQPVAAKVENTPELSKVSFRRSSKRVCLTEVQKVLLVTGGMGHFLRNGKSRKSAEDTKAGRKLIEAAKASAAEEKDREKRKKAAAKASNLMHAGMSKQ